MAEKTEKATPKKLRDARKKGQVAKSQDFPSAFTFIISISAVLLLSSSLYQNLSSFMIASFRAVENLASFENSIGGFIASSISLILDSSLPIMLLVSGVGVLVNFLLIGPLFAVEAMKPDIKRLNPVTNIKNMFKLKTFVELLKSILKITGALILIYSVIYNSLQEIVATCGKPFFVSAIVFSDFLEKVIIRVGIFFIVIGIFDLVFQRKNFAKEMKMEKFEVKQEYKDTEGDPHIKSKRRQTAHEIAYQDGPRAVMRAKAVITNPTHIAVAIEYDAANEPAPKIATMGQDIVAKEIVRLAVEKDIPVMRNVDLAHTLYYKCDIGGFVPEETYEAIAEILKWIAKLEEESASAEALEIFRL